MQVPPVSVPVPADQADLAFQLHSQPYPRLTAIKPEELYRVFCALDETLTEPYPFFVSVLVEYLRSLNQFNITVEVCCVVCDVYVWVCCVNWI